MQLYMYEFTVPTLNSLALQLVPIGHLKRMLAWAPRTIYQTKVLNYLTK